MQYKLITALLLSRGCDWGGFHIMKMKCVCVCVWEFGDFHPSLNSLICSIWYALLRVSRLYKCFWNCCSNWSQTCTGDPLYLIPSKHTHMHTSTQSRPCITPCLAVGKRTVWLVLIFFDSLKNVRLWCWLTSICTLFTQVSRTQYYSKVYFFNHLWTFASFSTKEWIYI